MGLDSLELLVEIERFFCIKIPNAEAEKIYTVQDMVDIVSFHLDIISADMIFRDAIFTSFQHCIQEIKNPDLSMKLTDSISIFLPLSDKASWQQLEHTLGMNISKPYHDSTDHNVKNKIKSLISWTHTYNWDDITVERFINAIGAENYEKIFSEKRFTSKHEIFIAVAGITAELTGADFYEILPEKSFTSDLGID